MKLLQYVRILSAFKFYKLFKPSVVVEKSDSKSAELREMELDFSAGVEKSDSKAAELREMELDFSAGVENSDSKAAELREMELDFSAGVENSDSKAAKLCLFNAINDASTSWFELDRTMTGNLHRRFENVGARKEIYLPALLALMNFEGLPVTPAKVERWSLLKGCGHNGTTRELVYRYNERLVRNLTAPFPSADNRVLLTDHMPEFTSEQILKSNPYFSALAKKRDSKVAELGLPNSNDASTNWFELNRPMIGKLRCLFGIKGAQK